MFKDSRQHNSILFPAIHCKIIHGITYCIPPFECAAAIIIAGSAFLNAWRLGKLQITTANTKKELRIRVGLAYNVVSHVASSASVNGVPNCYKRRHTLFEPDILLRCQPRRKKEQSSLRNLSSKDSNNSIAGMPSHASCEYLLNYIRTSKIVGGFGRNPIFLQPTLIQD